MIAKPTVGTIGQEINLRLDQLVGQSVCSLSVSLSMFLSFCLFQSLTTQNSFFLFGLRSCTVYTVWFVPSQLKSNFYTVAKNDREKAKKTWFMLRGVMSFKQLKL